MSKISVSKRIFAWCMYDWAASVYSLVITSSIFPIYFSSMAVNDQGGDVVLFLGFPIRNSVIYTWSLSFVFLFVAILNPILTAIADYGGIRKRFMQFFVLLGSTACAGMYFFEKGMVHYGILMFVLAGIGYSGSWVFYNSYLPQISPPGSTEQISAKGYAYGYIGSVLLLIFNLAMIMNPGWFWGITEQKAIQISFLSVGAWWLGFSMYTFYYLPEDSQKIIDLQKIFYRAYQELRKVAKKMKTIKGIRAYLLIFFLFNMGVQTTMYVATIFAEKELQLPASNLIATVLLLQIIAVFGALFFAKISRLLGSIPTLIIQLVVWIGICVGAYFVKNGNEFYVLAAFVGLVMGGIQSLARAIYAGFIPKDTEDPASFFSYYEVVYNISIVFGTFLYGFTEQISGTARNSVWVLGIFFVSALAIVIFKKKSLTRS